MGIYVPFANHLPSSCDFCYISLNSCEARDPYVDGRPNNCPLVELPPHGRLIDADAEPSEVARVIATIIENEQDMRVISERKHGKWIEDSDPGEIIGEHWACSECHMCYGHMNANYLFNYCPNCGAKMAIIEAEEADDGNNDT